MVVERQPLNYRKENRKPWPPHLTAAQRMSRRYRSVQDTAESVKELGTDGEERPAPGKCGSQRPAPAGGGHSRLRAPHPSAEPPRGQHASAPSGPLAPRRQCIQPPWAWTWPPAPRTLERCPSGVLCAEHKQRLQPQCADSPEPRSPVAVAPWWRNLRQQETRQRRAGTHRLAFDWLVRFLPGCWAGASQPSRVQGEARPVAPSCEPSPAPHGVAECVRLQPHTFQRGGYGDRVLHRTRGTKCQTRRRVCEGALEVHKWRQPVPYACGQQARHIIYIYKKMYTWNPYITLHNCGFLQCLHNHILIIDSCVTGWEGVIVCYALLSGYRRIPSRRCPKWGAWIKIGYTWYITVNGR